MQLLVIALVVLASVSLMSYKNKDSASEQHYSGELEAVADNFILYHNYVSLYAKNNPTAAGVVADVSLGLPVWYRKIDDINHYIERGRSYSYISDMPGLAATLAKKTHSISVGFNRGGSLYSVTQGTTSIAIPSQVPDGHVVYFQ